MINKIIITLFSFIFTNLGISAEIIRSYQIPANDKNIAAIAKEFEIVARNKNGFEVYVLEEKTQAFLKLSPKAKLIDSDVNAALRDKAIPVYRNYTQVENDLKTMARQYPNIAKLETYGKSGEGRSIYALKLSSGGKNKAQILITGATHGDELITTEMLFILTNELLKAYGKDQRLTNMINGRDIYIVPVVSPDSFEERRRYVNRIDPNRAFPRPDGKPSEGSVDVINSLISFTDKIKFNGILDLHAYGKLVMYPWSYTKVEPASSDLSRFQELASKMAKVNKYKTGQISRVLYEAEGSSGDYFYWKNGTISMAVEIGREKIPHWDKFPAIADEVREMIWAFVEYFN
jgi:hypothetical protein